MGGIMERNEQMCVDLANSREEISVNMMRVLLTHYTLGFFSHFKKNFNLFYVFYFKIFIIISTIIIIIISYFKGFLPFNFKLNYS